jgi:hypothetical protein
MRTDGKEIEDIKLLAALLVHITHTLQTLACDQISLTYFSGHVGRIALPVNICSEKRCLCGDKVLVFFLLMFSFVSFEVSPFRQW